MTHQEHWRGIPFPEVPGERSNWQAIARDLRRPFEPAAVKWKVQTVWSGNKGAILVAYIDARLVIERLNHVVPGEWEPAYSEVPGKANLLWCHLSVCGVVRRDVGESPKGMSKDLISDALKRAAVQHGVGVSVYALPTHSVSMEQAEGRIALQGTAQKQKVVLTAKGHQALREWYSRWLDEKGEEAFGPVLPHGDIVSDEPPVEDDEPETPTAPALDFTDPRNARLRDEAVQFGKELGMSKGMVMATVLGLSTLKELEDYVDSLGERVAP